MTPEAQRIAIAEECGWKNHNHPDVMQLKQGWTMPEKWCMDPKGVLRFNHDKMPDYLNDLNAMHDAEKMLTADQFEQYRWILWDICKQVRVKDWYRCYLSSTAAQRAEAFLRTIGKWKGAK
jgi:hypothetical protein